VHHPIKGMTGTQKKILRNIVYNCFCPHNERVVVGEGNKIALN